MPVLVWESPRGRVVMPLEEPLIVVGCDAHSDLHFDAASVSGRHALIEVRDGAVKLTDLKSGAGTRINGAQITPEMPSTIEPGDFVHFGDVMVTLLKTPPPPGAALPTSVPAPAPKAKPKPVRPRAPAVSTSVRTAAAPAAPRPLLRRPELWVGGATLLAGVVVAAVFLLGGNGNGNGKGAESTRAKRAEPPPSAEPDPAQATPEAAPDTSMPATEPVPEPQDPAPRPDATAAIPRAQDGALPPDAAADVEFYPYLLELDDGSFRPVRVLAWNQARVECVGGDGYLYEVDRVRIESVQERGVLKDLAGQRLTGLLPSAIDDRLVLAQWCAQRHLRETGLKIVNGILGVRPDHAEARKLKQALEGGR